MEWISVKKRVPKLDDVYRMSELVLVTDGENIRIGYYAKLEWKEFPINRIMDVTHWMPLPEPPKE